MPATPTAPAQTRTPITDGARQALGVPLQGHLRSWWSNPHYDRPGGVGKRHAHGLGAASRKPIWFTELGCPAVDKGANQPNVFHDPKSSESDFPYFSRGMRDDLIQRRHLRAFLEWYDPSDPGFVDAQNPVSSVYADRMVDTSRVMLYTWDARPYPAFPATAHHLERRR